VIAQTWTGARVQHDLGALDAMAAFARRSGSVVHVVVAREPGTTDYARRAAAAAGVAVSIDLMAGSLRARFDGA
jgi:pyruvoyl-dependent arginine decarboxylase (PvlArgDC)